MKKTAFLLFILMLIAVSVHGAEIYSYTTREAMTDGVTHIHIKKFYSDYSLNINCVEADLSNSHISLELLKSAYGCDKALTVSDLATTRDGVVAATNADFFSYYSGNEYFSLGIEIKDGELLQSHINKNMAAGIVTDNTLLLSYIDFGVSVTAANGAVIPIAHINKPTDYYGAALMYTAAFNRGTSPYFPNGITVITIENNVVTKKGTSLGGTVGIPQNGYILAINDSMTPILDCNLNIGDSVITDISVSPSIDNAQTAFGGGTMLVSGGQKAPVTHSVNGTHPRTAIGTSDNGKKVYLITVDGRQQISRGVTLDELASICMELGCTEALNFDGGGSTAMVGKTLENGKLHTLNSPSENRRVINGAAIVSDAVPGQTVGFELKTVSDTILSGDYTKITLIPYDENHNRASSCSGTIEWKITKGSGRVENNIFYADSAGETVVELYYNNEPKASHTFNVISDICGIDCPSEFIIKKGGSAALNVNVFDKHGNSAPVSDISVLKPVCDISFLEISDGKLIPKFEGYGILTLSYGEAVRNIKIRCGNCNGDILESVTADPMMNCIYSGFTMNIAATSAPDTLFSRFAYGRVASCLKKADASAVLGNKVIDLREKPSIYPDGFSERSIGGAHIITLGMTDKNTLRTSGQWDKFTASMACAEKNIIILMKNVPNFSDSLEGNVFRDLLADAAKTKNVFVIYNGTENHSVIDRNVRYISLADVSDYAGTKGAFDGIKYLSLSITPDSMAYSFNKVFTARLSQGIILE